MNRLKIYLLIALGTFTYKAMAQTDKATTASIVPAKTYTFVARSATPLNVQDISNIMGRIPGGQQGGSINLTEGYYELKVTPDSIVAFLPYYGRAFNPSLNPNDSGVRFTSKKFEYKSVKGKKHGWNININTQDVNENYRITLNIGDDGYATLSLNSNNKQSISYNGYLKENDKKP